MGVLGAELNGTAVVVGVRGVSADSTRQIEERRCAVRLRMHHHSTKKQRANGRGIRFPPKHHIAVVLPARAHACSTKLVRRDRAAGGGLVTQTMSSFRSYCSALFYQLASVGVLALISFGVWCC